MSSNNSSSASASSSTSPYTKTRPSKPEPSKNDPIIVSNSTEQFTFFFGKSSVFSNFYPAKFVEDDRQFYNTEQYFHYKKAVEFNDDDMTKALLQCQDPVQAKLLGRRVSGYDEVRWNSVCQDVMKSAVKLKFGQNPELLIALLDTNGTSLVEANPRDLKWGIGLGRNNPKSHSRSSWRGQNLLGSILDKVRLELFEETNTK